MLREENRLRVFENRLDDFEDDIKALGKRRWRINAQDRNEWTAIKREAKVKLKGP
jgi:hypothetical protein